jgi:glucans biosynthesis protein
MIFFKPASPAGEVRRVGPALRAGLGSRVNFEGEGERGAEPSPAPRAGPTHGTRLLAFAAIGGLFLGGLLRAAETKFDFETVRARARTLAAQPYVPPTKDRVPEWLRTLSYDDYRIIEFDAAHSLWRKEKLPFQMQFFHPGQLFNRVVAISEIRGGRAEPVAFRKDFFNYHQLKVGDLPDTLGFAGFKLLYPLNRPNDELGAFLGASYFRMLCAKAFYGLSARGLALDTAEPTPEEFPDFTEFWIERPDTKAKTIAVYALLDSPSVAGAYRFAIAPGADTVMQVRTALFRRKDVKVFGVAPLTSMFWRAESSNLPIGDDFRPEIHDSDGLLMHTGAGEWIWRPLVNPKGVSVVAFGDENPRAFGLLQRDREFDHYRDLEAHYHLRPSAWVEPVGPWGRGTVRLVELPTKSEYADNIVAFWTPEKLPPLGEPIELEYRLHWGLEQFQPPAGFATATYHQRTYEHERFLVDFAGPELAKLGGDAKLEPVVTVGATGQLTHTSIQKNIYNGSWRVTFVVKADGTGKPVDLACHLRRGADVLTEKWTYLWQP